MNHGWKYFEIQGNSFIKTIRRHLHVNWNFLVPATRGSFSYIKSTPWQRGEIRGAAIFERTFAAAKGVKRNISEIWTLAQWSLEWRRRRRFHLAFYFPLSLSPSSVYRQKNSFVLCFRFFALDFFFPPETKTKRKKARWSLWFETVNLYSRAHER